MNAALVPRRFAFPRFERLPLLLTGDHGRDITGCPPGGRGRLPAPRLPQNVACRFPALRSSEGASQHGDSLQLRVRETAAWTTSPWTLQNHRLYVPRSTHTMVIGADSGKTIADIPGQKHNHGVALAPEAGRGFITDGEGSVL